MTSDITLHPDDRLELQVGDQVVTVVAQPGPQVVIDAPGALVVAHKLETRFVDNESRVSSSEVDAERVIAARIQSDEVRVGELVEVGHEDPDTRQPGRVVVRGEDGETEAIVLDGSDPVLDLGVGGTLRLGLGATITRRFLPLPNVGEGHDGPALPDQPDLGGGFGGRFGPGGDDDDPAEDRWVEVDLFDELDELRQQVQQLQGELARLRDRLD